ncbi:protein-serine O-palmitoleoyltransferase porcupine [Phymastichus coffea]|uniref:protein-serine O-palmitoleoyltransferase porcupine n=1 Tax=Phymastichus coffea TaxID=108790 RepID=UPI00273B7470|nr:protein-serine O-palmitoleoyltransferase porcupine [Phymastichus coffea]
MDSLLYDDDADCGDQCFVEYQDDLIYDYPLEQETLSEMYNNCIVTTIYHTFVHLIPLISASLTCNLAARITYISHDLFHSIIALIGIIMIWHYAFKGLYLLVFFTFASYFCLFLPKSLRSEIKVFIPSLLMILYCEYFLKIEDWHSIKSVIMVASMKASSVAIDIIESDTRVNCFEYAGYMLCSATTLFGPWVSFENYKNLYRKTTYKLLWIFVSIGYMAVAFFFLCVSNCWTNWILSDNAGKWMLGFRDALSFRTSHYFICFLASSLMMVSGFPISQTLITKPLEIEVPRSLVQVVVSWNIPMHNWLKTYVFRPSRRQLGRFGTIILTYAVSALLHGLNFQIAAVLLSLGFYTFIEYQLRNTLANVFDACITSKQCSLHKCEHSRTLINCYWVILVNVAFSALAIFHLAYLGLPFDRSTGQETGYCFEHTIEKWSQYGYSSHLAAFATYCAYHLIS